MSKRPNFKEISVHEGPKQSLGFLLWHISTSWRSTIEAVLKSVELTHPQFVILAATGWLTRNGKFATQIAIGKMAGLDPNTTSQIIKGLELKKLVKREKSTDGRAKNVFLTSTGGARLSRAMPKVEKTDGKFFSILAEREMSNLLGIFQKLIPEKSIT